MWKKCALGDLVTFQRGYDLPKTQMKEGPYPVIGSNGIIGYHNEYTIKGPVVTIGRSGNVGNPFIVYGNAWAHNTTLYVKEFKRSNPIFIYYLLKTLNLGNYAGGSAVPTLNRNHIHSLPVIVPESIEEQKWIGEFLKLFDDKIVLNNKINDNLEQQAQAYFQKLFIDNKDPQWKKGTISDLGEVVGGGTPSKKKTEYYCNNGIAWITPKDLSLTKAKFISHGETDISLSGFENSSVKLLPEGAVLFSSRAPIGYIAIAANEVTTNQGFKSVIPKRNIGTAFVYYFLKSNLLVIEGMASGSTFKEVSGRIMKQVPVIIPDQNTLNKFNEFCKPILIQQKILEKQNHELAILRDSLIPKLISENMDFNEVTSLSC